MTTEMIVHPDAVDDRFNLDAEDLYEVLGLKHGATNAQIRKAYRRASMKYHPDRNGGTEEAKLLFQKIKEAYETLSNFSMREFYDNTGRRKPSDSEIEGKAREFVHQVFTQAFDVSASNEHPQFEIKYYDPVADVLDAIGNAIRDLHKQRNDLQRTISRHENLRKRFKKKNDDFSKSPLDAILEQKIKKAKQRFSLMQMDINVQTKALEFAREYECAPEPREPQTVRITGREFPATMFFKMGNDGTTGA